MSKGKIKKINETQRKKILKVLRRTTFCALSTSFNDEPHTTIVQPSITSELDIIVLSNKKRKKIRNIQQNNKVWLTFDAAGILKIPKVIYIKGKAELETLNQETFESFLSYHGWITKKIYKKLTAEGLDNSMRIVIKPEEILTIGIFDKLENTISFTL